MAAFPFLASATARAGVKPIATLTPAAGQLSTFGAVAASGSTVVAASTSFDVYAEPAGGWRNASPSAVLGDRSTDGVDRGADSASVSGGTIVAGFVDYPGIGYSADEDVFVRPPAGWSGTPAPSAQLLAGARGEYVSGGVVEHKTIAAFVSKAPTADNEEAAGATVDIYQQPTGGWSGDVASAARLALPVGTVALSSLAFTGSAVFVPTTAGKTLVYRMPADGWAGKIKLSATLQAVGQVDASGNSVLVGHSLFVKPKRGWSGTPNPVAELEPQLKATAINPAPEEAQALAGSLALYAEVKVRSGEGCGSPTSGCPTTVYAASRPAGGWSGKRVAAPVLKATTSGVAGLASTGDDLFFPYGNSVKIYNLAGRYGTPTSPAAH